MIATINLEDTTTSVEETDLQLCAVSLKGETQSILKNYRKKAFSE